MWLHNNNNNNKTYTHHNDTPTPTYTKHNKHKPCALQIDRAHGELKLKNTKFATPKLEPKEPHLTCIHTPSSAVTQQVKQAGP